MPKICVFGNTASGKSTLVRRLSEIYELMPVSLDRLYWRENWTHVRPDSFVSQLTEILSADNWLLDGTFAEYGLADRFAAADRLILLDSKPLDCLRRASDRRGKETDRLPDGTDDRHMTRRQLVKFVWEILTFNLRDRRQILKLAKRYPEKFVLLKDWNDENKYLETLK